MPPCTGGIHRRSHQRVSERWGGVWGWRRQDSELQPASSYQKQSESESVVSTAKRVAREWDSRIVERSARVS